MALQCRPVGARLWLTSVALSLGCLCGPAAPADTAETSAAKACSLGDIRIIPAGRLQLSAYGGAQFGAVVGVPISMVLADVSLHPELLAAFVAHSLLLWRDQALTPEDELALMRLLPYDHDAPAEKLFGPLGIEGVDRERYTRWRLPQRPEILLQGEGEVIDHHGLGGRLSSGKPTFEVSSAVLLKRWPHNPEYWSCVAGSAWWWWFWWWWWQ